jgi:hypothetical protein
MEIKQNLREQYEGRLQMVFLKGHGNEMDFKLFNKILVPDQG